MTNTTIADNQQDNGMAPPRRRRRASTRFVTSSADLKEQWVLTDRDEALRDAGGQP